MRSRFFALSWIAAFLFQFNSTPCYAQFGPEFTEEQLNSARKSPEPIHRIFRKASSPDDRSRAYRLLVDAQATGFEQVIRDARFDPLTAIRVRNVHHLGQVFKGDELVEEYLHLTNDKNAGARYNAVEALQKFPSEKALFCLFELLGDEDLGVRDRAASSLWRWEWPDMSKTFQKAAQSPDRRRAGCAATFLANYYDQKVDNSVLDRYFESELELLTGPPYRGVDNVVGMIRALGKQGTQSSLLVLEKASKHSHRSIRAETEKACMQIRMRL